MIRNCIYNEEDLKKQDMVAINNQFDRFFGPHWPQVRLRRWEYVSSILFADILDQKKMLCLEAGAGMSVFSPFIARIGHEIHSFDMGRARRPENKNMYCHDMSMTDIRFQDETFDRVFAISSIEHVNAGRFAIQGMPFDTGDSKAFSELCRVLKPGGIMILTTDFANRYYPPPGLWDSGSHRIYSFDSMCERFKEINDTIFFYDEIADNIQYIPNINRLEPIGYDYTVGVCTLIKKGE